MEVVDQSHGRHQQEIYTSTLKNKTDYTFDCRDSNLILLYKTVYVNRPLSKIFRRIQFLKQTIKLRRATNNGETYLVIK